MISFDTILATLRRYRYLAMFGTIFLSSMGLPVPEEVTLLASGLAVGWGEALFAPAAVSCVAGILASDVVLFSMGRYCGDWFLSRPPFRWAWSPRRAEKVRRLFDRYGSAAVFIARFFAVFRLGVFVWAGQQRMHWARFILLDLAAAVISGPVTILLGVYAARRLSDPEHAMALARRLLREGGWALFALVALLIGLLVIRRLTAARHNGHGGDGTG